MRKIKFTRLSGSSFAASPTRQELAILNGYYTDELKTMDKKTANKVLAVGEYPIPDNLDKVTLAAMMKVVDTIYNMEEAIEKT